MKIAYFALLLASAPVIAAPPVPPPVLTPVNQPAIIDADASQDAPQVPPVEQKTLPVTLPPTPPADIPAPATTPAPADGTPQELPQGVSSDTFPAQPTPAVTSGTVGNLAPSVELGLAPERPTTTTPAGSSSTENGFKLVDVPLNDIFQYLAREAGKQYFQNSEVTQTVTGQMLDGDPVERMQEIAFQYGISLYERGNTIYAIPPSQIALLPQKQAEFKLRYLRPQRDRLMALLAPFVTPGRGTVEYEDKTNTVIVNDNDPAIGKIATFLERIDRPSRQVAIQVRVFRVNSDASNFLGFDWSGSLGAKGLNLQATAQQAFYNAFGADLATTVARELINSNGVISDITTTTSTSLNDSSNRMRSYNDQPTVLLGPTAVNVVLRALYGKANVEETISPTIVTEDNETAVFENINKIPIVTSTVDNTNSAATVSSEVAYTGDGDYANLQIGTTLTVRPTVLPDNTIRLVITPSVGSVVRFVEAPSGDPALPNQYPETIQSKIQNIATIPNGYTLAFGGFAQDYIEKGGNKVPLLGDIPVVNFFFKSTEDVKRKIHLLFVITATATDLGNPDILVTENERIRRDMVVKKEDTDANDEKIGSNPDPDLVATVRNEIPPISKKKPSSNVLSPRFPGNRDLPPIITPQQQKEQEILESLPQADAPQKPRKSKPWEMLFPRGPLE